MKLDEFIVGFIIFIMGVIINFYINSTLSGFMIGIGLAIMIYSYYDIKETKNELKKSIRTKRR